MDYLLWIIVIVLLLIILNIAFLGSSLIKLDRKVSSLEESIDINISKRYDLLVRIRQTLSNNGIDPQILNTMFLGVKKGFDTTNIILFDLKGKAMLSSQMSVVIRNLNTLQEEFPQLQKDSKYEELVVALKECEDDYKNIYNNFSTEAKHLNNVIKRPVFSLIAKVLKIRKRLVN